MKRLFLLLALCAAAPLQAADLTVLATADTHADTAGWGRLAPLIVEERNRAGAENTLLIDAGDTLAGHFDGSFSNGAIPLAILNFLRFDVWVPGNHDFEHRPPPFGAFRGAVVGGDWRTGGFTPAAWRMFERAGHRIAVIGLGESGMAKRLLPDPGVRFADHETVLARAVREALSAGAELLILVRHDGLYASSGALHKLLRRHPEIALVIGAHTHQEIAGKKVGRAWYVQPGCHARCFAVVRVRFRDAGAPPLVCSELCYPASDGPEMTWPPEIAAMIRSARELAARPAGRAANALAPPSDRDFSGGLGDLIEETIRQETGASAVLAAMYRPEEAVPGMTAPSREAFFRLIPFESRIFYVDLAPEVLTEVVRGFLALQRRRKDLAVRFGGMKVYRDRHGALQRVVLPPPGPDGRIRVGLTDYELTGCAGAIPALFPRGPWRDTGAGLREAAMRRLRP